MKQKLEIITCIRTEFQKGISWKYLTLKKDYQVVDNENGYTIVNMPIAHLDDSGDLYTFPYKNFYTKQELRDIKLNKLRV